MKTIYLLSFLFISSCAHVDMKAVYYADTAKVYKCQQHIISQSIADTSLNSLAVGEKKDSDQGSTGYKECITQRPEQDTIVMECKKPMVYKTIYTSNLANCHKFMADNKLI